MSKHYCECSNKKTPDQDMCNVCSKMQNRRYNIMKDGIKENTQKKLQIKKRDTPKDYNFGTLPWLKQGLKA